MKFNQKYLIILTSFTLVFFVFLILAFCYPNPLSILLTIFIGFIEFIGILPIFLRPDLRLDLENNREELIRIFRTQSWRQFSQADIPPRTDVTLSVNDPLNYGEHSKYIRIKLINEGKKVAENCKIKLKIFSMWGEEIHEESLIYPAGQHTRKFEGLEPLPVNISPNDSLIFDICSSNNINLNRRLIRFEDSYTFTKIHEDINLLNTYFITLKVSCDNFKSFKKQFKIFVNNNINDILWRRLDIIEISSEIARISKIILKIKLSIKKRIKNYKNNSQTTSQLIEPNETNISESMIGEIEDQPTQHQYQETQSKQDYTTGDKIDKI